MLRSYALQPSREQRSPIPKLSKKPRPTWACTIQEAKAACSMAIRDAETWRAFQAELLQRQHGKVMPDLEEQVIQEESRCQTDFLSACQAALHTSLAEVKGMLVASYQNFVWAGLPCPTHSPYHQGPPQQRNSLLQPAPPAPVPKQSPRPKRWHPSPDPVDSTPLGGTMSKTAPEEPPSSKQWEVPPWNRVLKQSCSEAFSQDSDLVKEAREEYFSKHSYNFTTEGTCDLSEAFRQMAKSAKLLGTSIYEIKALWTGLNELRQANYALRSLPKGLKFLHVVPPSESPKVMDWWEYMTQMPFTTSTVWPTAPGVGRRARTRGHWLTTCGWCTTG